jgi:hypothetical protein
VLHGDLPIGASDLDAAAGALTEYGLAVDRQRDQLIVGRSGSPRFRVASRAPVRAQAAEIGEGTPHERRSDARFEIGMDDLDEVLDEANTLMEVQGTLQDASQGLLFLPWNGRLIEPWQGYSARTIRRGEAAEPPAAGC